MVAGKHVPEPNNLLADVLSSSSTPCDDNENMDKRESKKHETRCPFSAEYLSNLHASRKQFYITKGNKCILCKCLVRDHLPIVTNYVPKALSMQSDNVIWSSLEVLWMQYYLSCCEKLCYYDIEVIQAIWKHNGWALRSKRAIVSKVHQLRKKPHIFTSDDVAILIRGWE